MAVANAASVTGAAKVVNRSQTSVTKSIQDLEQQLGVSLFNRAPKGVSLTAELQDREFFAAINEGREPSSSVGKVLECYRTLHQIEQQL